MGGPFGARRDGIAVWAQNISAFLERHCALSLEMLRRGRGGALALRTASRGNRPASR